MVPVTILSTNVRGLYSENDCTKNITVENVNDDISANTVNGASPKLFTEGYIVP